MYAILLMAAHRNPVPTVDGILQKGSAILMVRRKKEPFQGRLALPGGFVNEGETVEDSFRREVLEETALEVEPIDILGVYSDPKRDPRKHTLSVVFIGLILGGSEKAEDDASGLEWVDLAGLDVIRNELAFDHAKILADYVRWKGAMGTYWSTKRRGS